MASIIERKNKEGKVTSYGFSISDYPYKAIREGGFKKKGEAVAAAKYAEDRLNIIIYVSERLGHSSLDITTSTYAHLLKELREKDSKQTAGIFERLFNV